MWLDKTYPCHRVCEERKVTHMENLCNLNLLVREAAHFYGSASKNTERNWISDTTCCDPA